MKRPGTWIGILTAFLLWPALTSAQPLVVDAAYVEQALERGALLWDARSADDYTQGHIDGAVNVGDVGRVFRDPIREDPPSAAAASRIFGRAGMDILGREVIVYSRRGDPYAYYAARMVEYYGGRHAKVYHGGIDDWKATGRSVGRNARRLEPIVLNLATQGAGAVGTRDVLDRLRQGGAQILDARTRKEFSGEDLRAFRGGRIPGAVNIPYEQNWQDPAAASKPGSSRDRADMALKSTDDLKQLYAKLDPDKETIVYCQSGVRASESAAILRSLGFTNVKVYEASWLGYAGVPYAPAEGEVFANPTP